MKHIIITLLSALFIIIPALTRAQLDLDQEVLMIPDTHDSEQYKWKKPWLTWGYDVYMEYEPMIAGNDSEITFSLKAKKTINEVDVFITDEGLNVFKHLRPEGINNKFKIIFNAPSQGRYRFEFVFKTDDDSWIDLSENVAVDKGVKREVLLETYKDYAVYVKLVPEKVYAEHVVTLLYEITHNGESVKYPDKIEGADILLASWDESRKEFIRSASRQNVDGQIAASIVFMKPGRHRVFAEFSHNGEVRVVQTDIEVLKELPQRKHGIFEREENIYD